MEALAFPVKSSPPRLVVAQVLAGGPAKHSRGSSSDHRISNFWNPPAPRVRYPSPVRSKC